MSDDRVEVTIELKNHRKCKVCGKKTSGTALTLNGTQTDWVSSPKELMLLSFRSTCFPCLRDKLIDDCDEVLYELGGPND